MKMKDIVLTIVIMINLLILILIIKSIVYLLVYLIMKCYIYMKKQINVIEIVQK